jgi:pimeloyl-ACP methyl ester carboxylesterase
VIEIRYGAAIIDAYGAALRATSELARAAVLEPIRATTAVWADVSSGSSDSGRALHWESEGSGPPVLLIMGLGLSAGAWWRTVPVLSRSLQVISFDNRGVGRSDSSRFSYTTESMSDDAVSVLDAAGVDSAHVYGFSLGGMIAQQLALRHPDRVRTLVLGATHPGGPRVVRPDREVMDFFRRRPDLPQEEAAWASVPYSYGLRCRREHADRVAEDIEQRLAHPFPTEAYHAQLIAASGHNFLGRLHRLDVPTLVVHGRHDRLVPVGNAGLLADRIPGAELRILEDSGHLYPTEEPDVNEAISEFILRRG